VGTRLAVYIFGLDDILVILGNGQFMYMENLPSAGFLSSAFYLRLLFAGTRTTKTCGICKI